MRIVIFHDYKKSDLFDPYVSCSVGTVYTKNIRINGVETTDTSSFVRTVEFDDINNDGFSSGKGTIGELICE